jgi:hypothetical protein
MLSMKYLNMNLLRIKPAPRASLNGHREKGFIDGAGLKETGETEVGGQKRKRCG